MIGSGRRLNHAMKCLPTLLAALVFASAALPAFAQGDGVPGLQIRPPEPAANAPARGSNLPLEHKVRLGLPPALAGDASADAPKLSIELGYGKAAPPAPGLATPGSLPSEYWGRANERAVKADLTFGF